MVSNGANVPEKAQDVVGVQLKLGVRAAHGPKTVVLARL